MIGNNEWEEVVLSDVTEGITVGFVGPMASEYVPSGIPFLRSTNIEPYRVNLNDVKFITSGFHAKLAKSALAPGDVVVVRTGKPGTATVIPKSLPVSNCSDLVIIHPGHNLDSHFLAYYFNSTATHYVSAHLVGAVQQHFNVESAKNLRLRMPPFPEQRAIAHILGSLDDKIELNRQMNATLEALARAIFKSWLVDFDPVYVKANGESPAGMDAATAALFPDDFEESELGAIPRGWRVGSILEFADLLSGGTPKTSEPNYWNGDIAWVSAKDVSNAPGVFLLDTERKISQAGIDNSSTKLLPAKATIITARGTVGANCLLGHPMTMNQTNYGLKAKEDIGDYFVYFSLKNLVERLRQQSYGTIFDTITTKTFRDTICVNPPQSLIGEFENRILPIMDAILNNQQQSRTLAELRDTLLPKLISGEVRVPEAEETMAGIL